MAITNSLNPGKYNMAFGANLFGFTGIGFEDKYVIKVKDGTTVVADLRQPANPTGDAVFDIQNILQSFIDPAVYYLDNLGQHQKTIEGPHQYSPGPLVDGENTPLMNSANEVFGYNVEFGTETNGVYTPTSTLSNFMAIGGWMPSWETQWGEIEAAIFIPIVQQLNNPCGGTDVIYRRKPLTDYNNYKTQSTLTGGYPTTQIASTDKVLQYDKVWGEDHLTVSFFNELQQDDESPSQAKSIEAFVIWQYIGDTLVSTRIIPNIQRNGGGPNVDLGDNATPDADNLVVTMGLGPMNLNMMTYYETSTGSPNEYVLLSLATHYYVTAHPWTPAACPGTFTGLSDEILYDPIRVDLVKPNCLDYDRFELSWQNSLGFRDYFTFNKKQQQSISVNRNDFLDTPTDYSGTAEYAGSGWYGARGNTTFAQTIQERYLVTTDYMSDDMAMYLRNLFQSPDVRARIPEKYAGRVKYFNFNAGLWFQPVNLLSASWVDKTYQKDKLFQYDVSFKMANNTKSMRG